MTRTPRQGQKGQKGQRDRSVLLCGSPQPLPTPSRPRALINAINKSNTSWTPPIAGGGVCPFLEGCYAVSNAAHSAPQRGLTHPSLFAPCPAPSSCSPSVFLFPAHWRQVLSAPKRASLPYDPPRDISLPRGPFLGCVRRSLQILPLTISGCTSACAS